MMEYIIIGLLAVLVGVGSVYLFMIYAELQKIRELLEVEYRPKRVMHPGCEPEPAPRTHDEIIQLAQDVDDSWDFVLDKYKESIS